jgi:hypothetical protein
MSELENKELSDTQEQEVSNIKQVSIIDPTSLPQESKSNKNNDILIPSSEKFNSYSTNNNTNINDYVEIYKIEHFKRSLSRCCEPGNEYIIKDFDTIYKIINDLKTLNNMQKNIILVRFHRISSYCLSNFKHISTYYSFSKIFIITCGILNPALLSINSNKENEYYLILYWIVWTLQLAVSLITSYISFYKWDRKYFLYNSYRSKINQEIWYFLELTGRYSVKEEEETIINHDSRLNLFLERIESLFRKLKNSDLEIEVSEDDKKENNIKNNYSHLNNQNLSPDYQYQNTQSTPTPDV